MPTGAVTSKMPGRLSARRRAFAALLPLAASMACAAGTAPAAASAASAASAATGWQQPTLCRADERIQFSCRAGAKTASLCASGPQGRIDSLTYRYGTTHKVESVYAARSDNSLRFQGTVMPASPGALVQQVWFDRGTTRYLLTQCTGGNCTKPSGLAVLRGERVLMNQRCAPLQPSDLDTFAPELVHFGSGIGDSRSHTPLLELGAYDNLLERLYDSGARRW